MNRLNHHFKSGDKIVSLAFHPPEIKSGTQATIINEYNENLIAVKLPDGELHRWFASFELEPLYNKNSRFLKFGDLAKVISDEGHPDKIEIGMVVKIAKVIPKARFYDLRLENGKYHRWIAGFEITYPI